jgi:hypothetical protein
VTTLSGRIALDLEDYFVIEVNTAITGTGTVSATNQFQFTGAVGNYSVQAYQGDTLVQTYPSLSGQQTITLPSSGTYNLRVIPAATSGFSRINFNNGGDRAKLLKIKAWGNKVVWSSFENAFFGCINNTTLPVYSIKNGQSVTNFLSCFRSNQLSSIPSVLFDNCPNVTTFQTCFFTNQLTTIPSGLLDNCPNVTNFQSCFQSNQLTTIPSGLFDNCPNVTNFLSCFLTNQLTLIPSGLFDNCPNVTSFQSCFQNNGIINTCPPDLFKFNTICTNWTNCFLSTTLATADYSGMLVSLNTFNANNATFHGGSSRYTGQDAIDARANLINVKNWTITDGGLL